MNIKIDWAIDMARHVAKLSKDPSTKVGAIIFDQKGRLVSAGFNGFARGVKDTPERLNDRDLKLRMVLHAERNAMAFATAPLDDCTMFVTHPCCAQCAASIIQSGISQVVYPAPSPEFRARWAEDYDLARMQFHEAGVKVLEVQV
jgi:dCMP deaminase